MTTIDVAHHAEMLGNRVRKNYRRLARAFEREQVGAFRLYDRDIPEVRAAVDWYEGHLVVAEYERTQTNAIDAYAEQLALSAGASLGVSEGRLHVRVRRTGQARGYGRRGGRARSDAPRLIVRERALKFGVNLDSYLDTGLFSDHRDTRRLVSERCADASVLNLFSYTGTFTCWAAHGGARSTVSVDSTRRYVDWASDNLALNGFDPAAHELLADDVDAFLKRDSRRFDLVIVDPPSRSTRFGERDFDVLRDHPTLLARIAEHVSPNGSVLFSTNHQRFEPRLDEIPYASVKEITEQTVPRDYRNRSVHRAFWLTGPAG